MGDLSRLRYIRGNPAPRFLVAGAGTFAVDLGTLSILHGVAGISLPISTVLAFGMGFIVNFTASRRWVFSAIARSGRTHRQAVRYAILVGANLCTTLGIVVGLSDLGVDYLLAKVAATGLNAAGNFFAYRYWVFPDDSGRLLGGIRRAGCVPR